MECNLIETCSGFVSSPIERTCWLKSGSFYEGSKPYDSYGRKASNMYIRHINKDSEEFISGEPVNYEILYYTGAGGKNIFDMTATEDECKLGCSSDENCTGFEYRAGEGKCWLKTGNFWEEKTEPYGDLGATLYIQHKMIEYIPQISAVSNPNYIYDHYNYAQGTNDVATALKATLQTTEIVFLIHMFYMTDLDMSDMADRVDAVNVAFKDNESPIRFKLENTTRIPKAFIDYPNHPDGIDLATYLHSTYAVFAPNTLNIFCGNLEEAGGWAGLPWEGSTNTEVVYLDTELTTRIFGGITETLVHEIGHWLGLHHTFNEGCYPGDYVIDTPPGRKEAREDGGSFWWIRGLSSPNTCGYANDQIENFMDYTSDAYIFSPGQVYRMMIFTYYKMVGEMPQYGPTGIL